VFSGAEIIKLRPESSSERACQSRNNNIADLFQARPQESTELYGLPRDPG
jgi:hypothetical protein